MQGRPAWVLMGGCALAFLASAVNVHFLIAVGVSVSHLTGDVSRFLADTVAGRGRREAAFVALGIALLGFLIGAAISGYFVHHPRLALERPYGRSIAAIGVLLIVAWSFEVQSINLTSFFAATACGMQNALATHYHGLILRTTHITGVITDLGQMIGMRISGHRIESWKLLAQVSIALAFAGGAAAGASLHFGLPEAALLVLGGAYVVGGLGWSAWKHGILRRRIA